LDTHSYVACPLSRTWISELIFYSTDRLPYICNRVLLSCVGPLTVCYAQFSWIWALLHFPQNQLRCYQLIQFRDSNVRSKVHRLVSMTYWYPKPVT